LKPKLPKSIEELVPKKREKQAKLPLQRSQLKQLERSQTRRHDSKNEAGSKEFLNAVEESNMP